MKPFRPVTQYLGMSVEDRAERQKLADARQKADMIEQATPGYISPEHLRRFAFLETECRHSHVWRSETGPHPEEAQRNASRVVELVWNEAFTAGVAHALATMSTRYLVVTAEEKAAFIAKAEQEGQK